MRWNEKDRKIRKYLISITEFVWRHSCRNASICSKEWTSRSIWLRRSPMASYSADKTMRTNIRIVSKTFHIMPSTCGFIIFESAGLFIRYVLIN